MTERIMTNRLRDFSSGASQDNLFMFTNPLPTKPVMLRSLIQLAAQPSVQPLWAEWLRRRGEASPGETSGAAAGTDGTEARQLTQIAYAVTAVLIVLSAVVNVFSIARDVAWRLGSPHNLWEPALWEITSVVVMLALVPLARRGAVAIHHNAGHPFRTAITVAALLLAFSALHIAGMGLLRELAYRLAGFSYTFRWAGEALYEFRKDLFAYAAIAAIFWLAERPARTVAIAAAPEQVAAPPAAASEFWLRDGRTSILIDANEIVSVVSAGNYVEFQLGDRRTHLIRTTLQAQEARLAPFRIVRVHRGRLVNLNRIVALESRASGDFELRLDSGETVAGSRRFRAALGEIAAGSA
jgi:DNA-binding LytR/AlgR family response regulator